MRAVAILNQKGGAGKTTTAVNLAAAMAQLGQRVLLVDLDPQSHATLHLGIQLGRDEPGLYDVLARDVSLSEVLRHVRPNLALVPAGIDLVGAEVELRERAGYEQILQRALDACSMDFDWALIDCPPSLGPLTVTALTAAEGVLIPLQPHFLALQGLGRLLETVTLVRQGLNPRLRVIGVVLCMYEKGTRLAQEVCDDVRHFLAQAEPGHPWHGARVYETRIRRNIKLAECPSFGQSIFDYAPASHGAEDYLALTQELLGSLAHTSPPPAALPAAQQDDATAVLDGLPS